jgi:hypothetical protein
MNKFDQVINEAGLLKSISNIASIAKDVATNTTLQPIKDLFPKTKSKLKHVTSQTAAESATGFKGGLNKITSKALIGFRPKFAINSVILDGSGEYEGMSAKILSYNDSLIKNFQETVKKIYNIDKLVNSAKNSGRFWVVISPKGEATVDVVRNQPDDQQQNTQQQNTNVSKFRNVVGSMATKAGNYLTGEKPTPTNESYFNKIVENYNPELIIEEANIIPFNTRNYDSYFIYESDDPNNVGKFYILPEGKKPSPRVGKTFLIDGEFKGLALVGNKTEYPFWYFLNDFEKAEKEEKEKELQKQGISKGRYYAPYQNTNNSVPQSTPDQGNIKGK